MIMTTPRILLASAMVLVVAMGARKAIQPPSPAPTTLTIKTHGVQLTQQEAMAIINQSKTFLPGLSISPGTISDGGGSGTIATCKDMDALLADKSADVHVVKSIGCCGKSQGQDIAGCSGLNLPMVVLPLDSHHPENVPLVAVQWMHELGHRKGLGHDTTTGSLMFKNPGAGNTATTPCELNAFLGLPAAACTSSSIGQQSSHLPVEPGYHP